MPSAFPLKQLVSGTELGRDTLFEGYPVSQLTTDSVVKTVSRTALGVNLAPEPPSDTVHWGK